MSEVHQYGFTWGPLDVTRMAYIPKRGYVVRIKTDKRELEVYVSEKGQNVRVWRGGKELS